MRDISFYETDFGEKPVEHFLADLEPAARAKVVRSLEMLRTLPVIPAKFWHKLSDQKMWEVRAEYAGNIYRILATTAKGNRVVLLMDFKRNRKRRHDRIWKLLNRDRSGIFNGTVTCNGRSPKVSREEHGGRSAICDRAAITRSRRSGCPSPGGRGSDPWSTWQMSSRKGARHCYRRGRNSPRARRSSRRSTESFGSDANTKDATPIGGRDFSSNNSTSSTGAGLCVTQ